MQIIHDTNMLKGQSLAATIGFFDGVHRGHRYLIDELKVLAHSRNLPSAVITFPVHPRVVLQADYQPKLLNSFEEKLKHLEETGIDYCIVMGFTPELSRYSAYDYIAKVLVETWNVKTLLIGYDHRFGYNRSEGFEQYVEYGKSYGVEVVKASSYVNGKIEISSSEIRRLLLKGDVEKAGKLLTYPYKLKGSVVNGKQVGRTIGFPTANIHIEEPFKVLPAVGVYAVNVAWDKQSYPGMLYIGDRPTLEDGGSITVEVNVIGFEGDLYDCAITVTFLHYIRGDIKFDSLEALKEQLIKDRNNALMIINSD